MWPARKPGKPAGINLPESRTAVAREWNAQTERSKPGRDAENGEMETALIADSLAICYMMVAGGRCLLRL